MTATDSNSTLSNAQVADAAAQLATVVLEGRHLKVDPATGAPVEGRDMNHGAARGISHPCGKVSRATTTRQSFANLPRWGI